NPLSGYADLLRDNESPTVRELAVRIRRASDRMAGVIDNLLSLSVAGHPRPGTVAVRAMIDEVLDDLRGELAHAKVTKTVFDCVAACSASVLSQILRNVVSNAAKYRAPDRELALTIAAQRTEGRVEIVVADNGA